jgi:hypothetical protein
MTSTATTVAQNGPSRPIVVSLGFHGLDALFDDRGMSREVPPREPKQVKSAEWLQPPDGDQPGGECEAEATEYIGTDDAVFQGFSALFLRESHDHGGEHGGVVHGQDPLDDDEDKHHHESGCGVRSENIVSPIHVLSRLGDPSQAGKG